ncbi:DEAD/DEAH box helicase [Paenibacillus sp. GCM10027628]|uniref:DEAD/DEAH box helicase n=1 Tax=Paenibacillus sp. GCM10027628 TaxID=3273413 RepID=UPI0036388A2E
MKGQLYAVHIGSRWTWNLTIHAHTDIHYWFEQYGADAGILLLEPFISLGQAMKMLQMISLTSEMTSWNVQSPSSLLTAKLQNIAQKCEIASHVSDSFLITTISFEKWKQGMFPGIPIKADRYKHIVEACSGRALLIDEIQQLIAYIGVDAVESVTWLPYLQLAYLNGDLELSNGLRLIEYRDWRRGFKKVTTYYCKRCGTGSDRMFWASCIHCGQDCPYCEECLTMGRTRFCSLLIRGRSAIQGLDGKKKGDYKVFIEPWGLSEAQTAASLEGLRYIEEGARSRQQGVKSGEDRHGTQKKFLIWAVTGAGKTEMIFPFIHHTVARGGRVLIATPRKDVVLELQPRIGRAFAQYSVVTLYGGSEQRWEQGQITIATTHQLLRFHEAFDLVIVDEIDAFPYHNNPMLAYVAAKVVKPEGTNILLSATPPSAVRKAAERGRLAHVRVPVRFHRHPLPVPQLLAVPSLRKCIQSKALPQSLLTRLQTSVRRGAQVFVFVPNIQLVESMVELLRVKQLDIDGSGKVISVEGTSSKDSDRTLKVQRFRDREIRVLVTTTILERGVTVPKSDVFILDADSRLFDEAALVQMAGRAGRSKDDPAGLVYFASKELTHSQKEAIRQIKQMNRIARKRGYLKGGNE